LSTLPALLVLMAVLAGMAAFACGHDLEPIAANPPADGLMVVQIVPDSQAKKLGMHVGDVLTHYDGAVLTDPQSLVSAVQAREQKNEASPILLRLIRDNEAQELTVAPGRLGVRTLAVRKGAALRLRPPATAVTYDFTPLKQGPMETWYAFHLDGQKVGFEHHTLRLMDDGRLKLESEVAFDHAEWGVQHFHVTTLAEITPRLRTIGSVYRFPPTDFRLTGELVERDGTSYWATRRDDSNAGDVAVDKALAPVERTIPADWQSDYLMAQVVAFMKPQGGACEHYTVFDLSTGHKIGPSSNYDAGEETLEIAGAKRLTRKYEAHQFGEIVRRAWIDPRTRVPVKFTYGGTAEAYLVTKAQALESLSSRIKPVTTR
jgi:hypothetical protein